MIFALSGFFSVLVSIIVFVLVLGTIILIHEFGHFLFARRAGILCHEFSIGMGPVIYQKKFKETVFSIRAIPIGGFVSMAGEQLTDELITLDSQIGLKLDYDEKVTALILDTKMEADCYGRVLNYNLLGMHGEELSITLEIDGVEKSFLVHTDAKYVFSPKQQLQIAPYNRSFDSKSLPQRCLTLFAGPAMNFVLAIFIYFIYWCATGVPNVSSPLIGSVSDAYPSYSQLEAGDRVKAVNGVEVDSWTEFSTELDKLPNLKATDVTLTILRDNQGVPYDVTIPLVVIINSSGLNNVGIHKYDGPNTAPSGLEGVQMGDISAFQYKSDRKDSEITLQTGDYITEIRIDDYITKDNIKEGEFVKVTSWSDVMTMMEDTDVADIYFKFYSQSEKKIVVSETPIMTHGNELLQNQRIEKIVLRIGVNPEYKFSLGGAFKNTFTSFWNDFTLIFRTLKLLIWPSGIRQVGVSNLSGVVGIFSMVDSYIQYGILPLLSLIALLSVNIGVMNLLPIPALDGGRLVFLAYEGITRKKPNKKFETILNNLMFILLMLLFLYVTFNDVVRLFK